jgi:AcrR family transcriptional regulator
MYNTRTIVLLKEGVLLARLSKTRRNEIKERILDTAYTFFSEKGYEDTKTRDISEKVGIAEGTLFNYFPSKAGLFLESMADRFVPEAAAPAYREKLSEAVADQVYDMLMSRLEGFLRIPKSILKEMTALLIQFSKKKSDTFQKLWDADMKVLLELENLIKALVEKKVLEPCDSKVAAESLFSAVIYETMNYLYLSDYQKEDFRRELLKKIGFILEGWSSVNSPE